MKEWPLTNISQINPLFRKEMLQDRPEATTRLTLMRIRLRALQDQQIWLRILDCLKA